MATQTETTCYRHPNRETRRLVLELRAPDLPGLHDAEPGRHALPGVRRQKTQVRQLSARARRASRA